MLALDVPDPDGAVDEAELTRAGGGAAVRVEQAVHAEVPVVLPFPVVAAVGIASVGVEDGVIHHLPDAAAHQIVVFVDLLPIGLCVAGADAHCMGVLAEEVGAVVERPFLPPVLADGPDLFHGRVHLAADVIGDPLVVDDALIVDGQAGVGLEIGVHRIRVAVSAGLVAEGPEDD